MVRCFARLSPCTRGEFGAPCYTTHCSWPHFARLILRPSLSQPPGSAQLAQGVPQAHQAYPVWGCCFLQCCECASAVTPRFGEPHQFVALLRLALSHHARRLVHLSPFSWPMPKRRVTPSPCASFYLTCRTLRSQRLARMKIEPCIGMAVFLPLGKVVRTFPAFINLRMVVALSTCPIDICRVLTFSPPAHHVDTINEIFIEPGDAHNAIVGSQASGVLRCVAVAVCFGPPFPP